MVSIPLCLCLDFMNHLLLSSNLPLSFFFFFHSSSSFLLHYSTGMMSVYFSRVQFFNVIFFEDHKNQPDSFFFSFSSSLPSILIFCFKSKMLFEHIVFSCNMRWLWRPARAKDEGQPIIFFQDSNHTFSFDKNRLFLLVSVLVACWLK